jgi:predicted dehydrogenase
MTIRLGLIGASTIARQRVVGAVQAASKTVNIETGL